MKKSCKPVIIAALITASALPTLTTEAFAGPMPAASPAEVGLQSSVQQVWYRGGYYRRGYGGYYRGGYYNPGAAIAAGAALGIAGAAAAAASQNNYYYYNNPGYYAYPGYAYPGYYGW